MEVTDMKALVETHLKAEGAGDVDGAISVYTDDIEHHAVGFPTGPLRGKEAVRKFYEHLTANFRAEEERSVHEYATESALVLEQVMTGTVIGEMLGLPGKNRVISFGILHVFEFRDGLICREQVWLDTAAIIGQLS